jgi:sialic acid synthase SpsE
MKLILIAELCQNHSGNINNLYKLMDDAVGAGATHLKIQTMFADDLSHRIIFDLPSHINQDGVNIKHRPYLDEYKRLKTLELDYKSHELFLNRCDSLGVVAMTTLFNFKHLPEIKLLGFNSIKIASYDCGSPQLVQAVGENFDNVFLSTGASLDEEIFRANAILENSRKKYHLLHCCTIYPTPIEKVNLSKMLALAQFTDKFGLSNHTIPNRDGLFVDFAAIFLGASVIERHFTSFSEDSTRDGPISIGAEGISSLKKFAESSPDRQREFIRSNGHLFKLILGTCTEGLSSEELSNRLYYRGRFCNKTKNGEVFNWEYEYKSI